jgi:tetratricopeptide (TPR) repeat protein
MITHILKDHIAKDNFPTVIRALRQNKIIWDEIRNNSLLEKLLQQNTENSIKWSPANIALTALNLVTGSAELMTPLENLDPQMKKEALEMLEAFLSSPSPKQSNSIEAAGLVAIAIRERWLMLDHIEENFFNFFQKNSPIWETIISILYGLIPNQENFVSCFINSPREAENSFVIHALLSQPLSIDHIASILIDTLLNQEVVKRSAIIRLINQKSPALAQIIAEKILEQIHENDPQPDQPFQQLVYFIEKTELLKLSGQYNRVIPELEQIWKTTTRMQANMTAQLAQAAARGNDQDTALRAIDKVSELENFIQSEGLESLTLAQINAGGLETEHYANRIKGSGTDVTANPANLLANAKIALENSNYQEAQYYAHQIYALIMKRVEQQDIQSLKPDSILSSDFLQTFLETLLEVNLPVEAERIGKLVQEIIPNNPEIVWLYAQAAAKSGDIDEAVEYTDIAFALSPNNLSIHRFLIQLLISQSSWIEARKESEVLVKSTDSPKPEDYTALAECYLHTGQEEDAIKTCQKGLVQHTDHWKIHHLLGTIYQQKGKISSAKKHYSKAIVEHPQEVVPWLQLSKLHQDNQEPDKALEKLHSAAEIIPNHPEIYLNIGLLQLEAEREIKAMAAFNQAARFIQQDTPNSIKRQIGLNLGKTLLNSGYVAEAAKAIEKTHKENPADAEVAYLYGQALMRSKRNEEAFKALTITIQEDNPSIDTYLDYVHLILELSKNPEKAIEYIHKVLAAEPKNERAVILLARATAAAEDHQEAIQLYQDAFQTKLAKEPEYFTLLATGIADSAFSTGQPEVAITFLQEALRKMPENLKIKQKLCKAFNQANLTPDALTLLDEIRATSDGNIENLLWIADQAIEMNQLDLAIEILGEANQISPQMAEVIVRLGYVQLENAQESQARTTFSQLFSAENVDVADMKMAAHALIGLGDISSSIPFIERALELCDYQSSDLLRELTKLHMQAGNSLAALDTIQKHIQIENDDADIWATKSDILYKIGRPKAALDALKEAIHRSPESATLHMTAAERYRERQDLAACLEHIQQAIAIDPKNNQIRLLAAEIHKAGLQTEEALSILEGAENPPKFLPWMLLTTELELENNSDADLSKLNNTLEDIQELDPEHPAGLSLSAWLKARMGKSKQAEQTLENAILSYSAQIHEVYNDYEISNILMIMGKAALELNLWEISLFLAREAIRITSSVPAGYLLIAKILTKRAEFQLKCQATQTITHAPGSIALHNCAKDNFQEAIEAVHTHSPSEINLTLIQRWETRGKYALLAETPDVEYTAKSASDLAAVIAAWRRASKKLSFTSSSDQWLDSVEVKFQLSLYYAKAQIINAESIAEETLQLDSPNPQYLANYAFIASRAGNQDGALEKILQALTIWPDEPRWHAFAANLEQENGNISEAITHLEHATTLEKTNPDHLFQLGQIYIQNNLPGNAVRVLQEAVTLNPLEVDHWVSLSQAFEGIADYVEAIDCIEKAISLAPNRVYSLLIAADLSYKQGNKRQGDQYIKDAQKLEPKNIEDIILLTDILVKQKKANEALAFLDQMIEYALSPEPLLIQKAEILGETKGVKEKLTLLVSLIRDHPKNPRVLSRLAATYLDANMPDEAIRAAQYAIKNAGDDLSNQEKSRLHYQLGTLYQKTGQLDQSLHNLTQAIKLSPRFLEAYLEIGETLRQRREYTKALGHFEKAIEIAPKDPRGYSAAGLLLKDGKDYSGAEAFFRKASCIAPNDIFIQRQLATVIALAIIHKTEKV